MKKGITRRDALKLSGLTLGGLALGGAAAGKAEAAPGDHPIDPMKRNDLMKSLLPYYPGRETLGADEMRITFMGTSPIPRLAQECSSVFVEVGGGPDGTAADQFVFDCGSGVIAKYNAMGIPMRNMNKIFLTHLHGDHMSDLTHIYCFGPAQDRKTPLFIWGPGPSGLTDPTPPHYTYTDDGLNVFCQKFRDIMRWHTESFSFGATSYSDYTAIKQADWGLPVDPKPVVPSTGPPDPTDADGYAIDGYSIVPIELNWQNKGAEPNPNDNVAYDNPTTGVRITHFPAIHTRKGSISYKLEWKAKGLSMIFSGDTKPNTDMIAQASGVTVLVHEMVVPAEIWAAKNLGLRKPPKDQTDPTWVKGLDYATNVQNSSHTPQGAFGYLLSQMDPPPKLAVATHFQATDDTIHSAFKSIRNHYSKGDVTIAADFMVISVTPDRITKRRAVVEDYAWYPVADTSHPTNPSKYHNDDGTPDPTAQIDPTDGIDPGPNTYDSSGY